MAQLILENVRCTLAGANEYGELRCDSSGVLVCPLPSSSSEFSPAESEFSSEVPSEFISSIEFSSEVASSPAAEISSLEFESSEEITSPSEEEISSEAEPSFVSSESAEIPSAESSEEISALPCAESNTECPSIGCDECCAVHISEIRTGSGEDFCPPSTDPRDIVLWFYTLEEISDFCRGSGEFCDFLATTTTQCDEVTDNAVLDFYVCCGCSAPSETPST